MDTRVATAELGWTAYPNSGVSCLLPTHAHKVGNKQKKKKKKTFGFQTFSWEENSFIGNTRHATESAPTAQPDSQIGRKAGKIVV